MNPKAKKVVRTIFALIVIAILLSWVVAWGYQVDTKKISYNANMEGVTKTVRWDWCWERTGPNTHQKTVGQAFNGDKVTLTGRTYEWNTDDPKERFWIEVTTQDGTTCWIAEAAVQPQYNWEA